MTQQSIPRVLIAATQSGSGKTTIVSGLLAALRAKGINVQAYKIGPDYIDPGYHRIASGKKGHNLDTWLMDKEKMAEIFFRTASQCDMAVVEGVMGLYDGGRGGISSTAEISKLLKIPVLLVIDVKSMGDSAAAIALGFKNYDPEVRLAGVILNRLGSDSHEMMIREAMEKAGIPVFGCMHRDDALSISERHLGLLPVEENDDDIRQIGLIREAVEKSLFIDRIIELAENAEMIDLPEKEMSQTEKKVRIGVADDEAFTFYYPESLQVLESMGAELVRFSPMNDATLPDVDGLMIGGGFPELFVDRLSENDSMKRDIREKAAAGLPVFAECGGLMYLTEKITDFDGKTFDMVGLIPAVCSMTKKLQTVGYVEAEALSENVLSEPGHVIRGHEFHFSTMDLAAGTDEDAFPWAFEFRKMRTGACYRSGFSQGNVLASYLHLHFAGDPSLAEHFIGKCEKYKENKSKN
ncbi:MAG: cobyrinate a,c-diamide synthase [Methanosarcinaceae archaeon]|nr:cobyrinate a,c-diamide synthase [Methanosarcinaceae archaeon]